jgi:hypothetical protein
MREKILSTLIFTFAIARTAAAADLGETTQVGGKGYFNLSSIDATSDGVDTDANGTGLDAKRFYISVDHTFDSNWSANITTDFNFVGNDGETQLFIKKAYLQGKLGNGLTVRIGSADLPWVPFVEGLYGYRYVENVLVEHARFATSADWGLHALGTFADGKVSYAVSAVNGNGYKNPGRSQGLDLDSRLSVQPIDGLTLAVGLRSGKRGQDKESVGTFHTAERTGLLAAYVKPAFRVGAEYFKAKNWNQVLSPLSDEADGYSTWGSVNLKRNVALFARYDDVTPSKDLAPDLDNTYFNVGVAFQARAKVDIAFVYKQDKVENGIYSTTNGTIGGTHVGKYNEFGVWTQVQF